jgi:hypothetical protein
MRRIRQVKVPEQIPKDKGVHVFIHSSLYEQMERIRKENQKKWGINLSQIQASHILAKTNKCDLIGGTLNAKNNKKKR